MIKSMTGYGSGKYEQEGKSFSVDIKSVNHKYSDISVKLPRTMLAFEDPVRKMVSAKISRGKVDVFVNYESTAPDDNSVLFNEALGDNVFSELRKIKERYGLRDDVTLSLLCRFPNLITAVKKDNVSVESELWGCLENAVNSALASFVSMRQKEGELLCGDMSVKIGELEKVVRVIDLKAPCVVAEYKERLTARLKELITDNADEQRVAFEIAVFADKSSIDEELTRLKSHTKQFNSILSEEDIIGKKLDFLVQEMLREANTIGSKSNNIDITNNVIKLKTIIEKIREQVQNVE